MASVSVAQIGEMYRVTLRGKLTAGDLKTLEHACGLRLQQKEIAVEIDVQRVNSLDAVARAYLDRLVSRGARIIGRVSTQG